MQRLGFTGTQPSCPHTWVVDVLLKHQVFVFCIIVTSSVTIVTITRISTLKREVT